MYKEEGYDFDRYIKYSKYIRKINELNIDDDFCNFEEKKRLLLEMDITTIKYGKSKIKVRTLICMMPQIRIKLTEIRRSLENYVSEYSSRYLEDLENGRTSQLINGEQNVFNFSSFYKIGPNPDSLPDTLDRHQIKGLFTK